MGDPLAAVPSLNRAVSTPVIIPPAGARARVAKTGGWLSTDGISADTLKITADTTKIKTGRPVLCARATTCKSGSGCTMVLEDAPLIINKMALPRFLSGLACDRLQYLGSS